MSKTIRITKKGVEIIKLYEKYLKLSQIKGNEQKYKQKINDLIEKNFS